MNILINAYSARLGGGQTYLKNLLDNLPSHPDLKIYLYVPDSLVLPASTAITRLTTRWPTQNPLLRAVWEKFVLPLTLKKLNIDVFFCPGGVVGTRAPKQCKTITMFRNMIPFDEGVYKKIPYGLQRLRNWMLARVMLKSMTAADLVIFISNYARTVIEKQTVLKKAVTIPHGIPTHFRQSKEGLSRPKFLPENNYILYVSKFDFYKHQYEVVSAYAKLPEDYRKQYSLVLVGGVDAIEYPRVLELIKEKSLSEQVHILGSVPYEELPAVYRFAYINIFASSCENCPNILLEAMSAGRPVLSSNVMPMPEFGGESVIYFSPYSADDLYEKMISLLSNEQLVHDHSTMVAQQSLLFDFPKTAIKTWSEIYNLFPINQVAHEHCLG